MPMETYDVVREWMRYGEENGCDPFFRFFCFFLAFNHLYDSKELVRLEERRKMSDGVELPDMEKIVSFLRHVLIDDDGPKLMVSVSEDEYALLTTVKWKKPRNNRWQRDNPPGFYWVSECIQNQPDKPWKTVLALMKVYRVRCNLFHSEKHITNERDREFVMTSTGLLHRFLKACADKALGVENVVS